MGGGGGGEGGGGLSAPDYAGLASQQGRIDKAAATAQTTANRPTQISNLGRVDWERTQGEVDPTKQAGIDKAQAEVDKYADPIWDVTGVREDRQAKLDALLDKARGPDTWTQRETLDPRFQAMQDQLVGAGQTQANAIANQGAFTGVDSIAWNPDAMKEYGDAIYGSVMDRAKPEQDRKESAYNNRLLQQGLQPGTAAYDNAMQNMLRSHGDVNTQAAQQATIASKDQYRNDYMAQMKGQDQAYAQGLQNYQMPWDMANAAVGAANNIRPSFGGYNQGTGYSGADMAGAGQAAYQAKMGDYNARQASAGAGK